MSVAVSTSCFALVFFCLLSMPFSRGFCAESSAPRDPLQPKSAEADAKNVIVKVGRHEGFVRFVFLSAEGNVYSASAKATGKDTIAVEFPPALTYHLAEKGPLKVDSVTEIARDVRIGVKRAGCVLVIENMKDFKVSKLPSPPRLVVDAMSSQPAPPTVPAKPQGPANLTEPAPRLFSFLIDAGHGGYDKGIQGEGFAEKDLALSLSRDLASGLAKKGRKIFVTRKADQVLTIRERLRLTSQRSPDLLLSIHVSSDGKLKIISGSRRQPGGQDDPQKAEAQEKAHSVAQAVAESLAQTVRGETGLEVEVESLPLALVTLARVPALLIEMPNPDKFSYEGKGREKLVASIVKGLTPALPSP